MTLDPQTYEVGWREASVRLTPTEFRILYLLATSADKVVPASRLYTYVWGSAGGDANALRSHISHLRRKLEVGVGGDVPGTISSVPAVGYIFRRSGPKPTAAASAPYNDPLYDLQTNLPALGIATAHERAILSEFVALVHS